MSSLTINHIYQKLPQQNTIIWFFSTSHFIEEFSHLTKKKKNHQKKACERILSWKPIKNGTILTHVRDLFMK